jgi:hypothetical protein
VAPVEEEAPKQKGNETLQLQLQAMDRPGTCTKSSSVDTDQARRTEAEIAVLEQQYGCWRKSNRSGRCDLAVPEGCNIRKGGNISVATAPGRHLVLGHPSILISRFWIESVAKIAKQLVSPQQL